MAYIEKEMVVIGSCLISRPALLIAREDVCRSDFLDDRTANCWDLITELDDRGASVDIVNVTSEMQRRDITNRIGGAAFLSKCAEVVSAPSKVREFCAAIREQSTLVKLRSAFADLSKQATTAATLEPVIRSAEDVIYSAREGRETIAVYRSGDIGAAAVLLHTAALENPTHCAGIPVGIESLDTIIPGFLPATLTYIGARPGIGKTSLACAMAMQIMQTRHVLIISLEMAMEELSARIMGAALGVSAEYINRGTLSIDNQDKLKAKATALKAGKLSVVDKAGLTFQQIRAIARREKANNRLDILMIDHFQIIGTAGRGKRYDEYTELSVNLKRLAKELAIPIVCLAQLSRQAADEEPEIHHLKETGGLEQDADIIILLNKPEPTERKIVLKVGKHRAGRTGQIEYIFNPEILEFRPMQTLSEQRDGY